MRDFGIHLFGVRQLVLCVTLILSASVDADVYRWVGEGGAVTYSNVPPGNRSVSFARVDVSVPQGKADPRARVESVSSENHLTAKVESLEKQLESERQAREAADVRSAVAQAAYEQHLANVSANPGPNAIPVLTGPLWVHTGTDRRHHGNHSRHPDGTKGWAPPVGKLPQPMQAFH